MKTYVNMGQEVMVVALNNAECCNVIDGFEVNSDQHCLDPEAQVTVNELGALDPTYEPAATWGGGEFVRNLGRRSLVVVSQNFNLNCYIPREVLRDSRWAAERIPLSDILVFDELDVVDVIRNMFPPNGIELRFNGHGRFYDRITLDHMSR